MIVVHKALIFLLFIIMTRIRSRINNTNCCVFDCKSTKKNNPELSFHLLPTLHKTNIFVKNEFGGYNELDIRRAWEINLCRKNVSKHTKVCSLHFRKEDFSSTGCLGKRYLLNTAVPSLNLPKKKNYSKPSLFADIPQRQTRLIRMAKNTPIFYLVPISNTLNYQNLDKFKDYKSCQIEEDIPIIDLIDDADNQTEVLELKDEETASIRFEEVLLTPDNNIYNFLPENMSAPIVGNGDLIEVKSFLPESMMISKKRRSYDNDPPKHPSIQNIYKKIYKPNEKRLSIQKDIAVIKKKDVMAYCNKKVTNNRTRKQKFESRIPKNDLISNDNSLEDNELYFTKEIQILNEKHETLSQATKKKSKQRNYKSKKR